MSGPTCNRCGQESTTTHACTGAVILTLTAPVTWVKLTPQPYPRDAEITRLRSEVEALRRERDEAVRYFKDAEVAGRAMTALSSPAEPASPEVKGVRRCPDCGSTYFNRDGAKALDEARAEGFRAGHLASVAWLDDGPEFSLAAHALRQAILPDRPSPTTIHSPTVHAQAQGGEALAEASFHPSVVPGSWLDNALRAHKTDPCAACGAPPQPSPSAAPTTKD